MSQNFQFELNGQKVFTGMKMPDVPLTSFAPVSADKILTIDEIASRVKNPNLVKIEDEFANEVEWYNQGARSSCFLAGTKIRMADGSHKNIEDIKLLDEVLTAEGNIHKVTKTFVHDYKGDLCTLKAWGHRHLKATSEHPILTKEGYKPISELTKDDWICIPKYMAQSDDLLETIMHLKARSGADLRKINKKRQQTLSVQGRTATTMTTSVMPEMIKLDEDFGWLIGLWLAEGSASIGKVSFHLHKDELDTLGAKAKDILKRKFDIDATHVIGRNGSANTLEVKFFGRLWAELFKSLCSTGSANKQLHKDLCKGPKDFMQGVLQGWMDGDGIGNNTPKSDSRNKIGGVTISHTLCMQMYDIANYLGYKPTICRQIVAVNPKHNIKSRQPRYTLAWPKVAKDYGDRSYLEKSEQTEDYVYRKVNCVDTEDYSGYVYNFEVEEDHSYVAEGIGVHNCNAFAVGWAMAVMHWRKTGEKLRLSPEWLYSKINGGRDQGSMLDDGMVEARENGMSAYQEAFYQKFRQSDFNMEQKRWATQSAENHKFLECYYAPKTSFEQMVLSLFTCLAEGGCIVMAVHVGNNYMRSGRTAGFDNGMGNHAIAGTGLRLLKDNPKTIHDFEIVSPQSWGKNFAEGGFTGIRAKHLELPGKYHAMYCINAMNSTRESSDKVSELEE